MSDVSDVSDVSESDSKPADVEPAPGPRERRKRLEDAQRLPRRVGFKMSTGQVIKIAMTLGLLVMLLLVQKPCASSVSTFVTGFGSDGSAGGATKMPKPGTVDVTTPGNGIGSESLEPMPEHMTKEEYAAMVARSRAKTAAAKAAADAKAAGSSTGSGAGSSTGSGR